MAITNVRTQQFSGISPLEVIDLGIGFFEIVRTASIVSATVAITVETGIDPTPQALAQGVPVIRGTVVSQRVTGGVAGTVYRLSFQATTDTGQVFEEVAYLPVIAR